MRRSRRGLQELDQDIRDHIQHAIEENLGRGMMPEEARTAALRAFGNVTLVKENTRAVWIPIWIDQIVQDARYSLRVLRKNPGFTAAAVLTLALSIGINATVFTVTNAVLFKGFPLVRGNDRLVYIDTIKYGSGCCVSYSDLLDWRTQAKSFKGIGAVADLRVTLTGQSGFPEIYTATQVTANTFALLGVRPILGRDFSPVDETAGAPPVAILSYGFWERRYGKDPAILGKSLRMNGAPATVVGIMPQGFAFPQNQDLWVPLRPTPDLLKREARGLWFAFGRMADGVTVKSASAEMNTIGKRLASAYPLTNEGFSPLIRNFHEFFLGPSAAMIYGSMWGAAGFVLLIACANLANLLLARAIGRSRDISVRLALGAGRWRIIRQLLVESVMLSSIGGFLGWWIAQWSVRVYELAAINPTQAWFGHLLDFKMDQHVVVYLIAISIGTGILFGLAPALRLSKFDVNTAMKDGARGATGGGRGKNLSTFLVVAEMALAVVLLAGAGVMIRSFFNVYTADLGVRTENILTALLTLPNTRYPDAQTQISFYERLKTRLEADPGVQSVAIANIPPTAGSLKFSYELAGKPPLEEQRRPSLSALVVSPAYFRTLGTAMLSGRDFNSADGVSGVPTAIVNHWFANKFWPGENPLGKRLRLFNGKKADDWLTVVGVAPNIVQNGVTRQEFDPLIYLPYREKPTGAMWVFARTRVPPIKLTSAFWQQIHTLDSELTIWVGPESLSERVSWTYWNRRLYGALFLIFAAIALLLASIGLYAVIAHSVNQRTQEIGIRMAIGATARDIFALVFQQGMRPMGIGLVLGLAASVAVNRVLKSLLVQVSPSDPGTLIAVSILLISSAALGCWIPARRAIRVDPAIAVRHD